MGAKTSTDEMRYTSPKFPDKKLQTTVTTKVQLLWTVHHTSVHRKLSFNILREICGYLKEVTFIPYLDNNFLQLYDLDDGTVLNYSLPHEFPEGAVYSGIDDQTLIVLGGVSEEGEAYIVNLVDKEVKKVASMKTSRSFPGILKYSRFVYVFGGSGTRAVLVSCEKFDLYKGIWTNISNMRYPRYSFSPCLYQGQVYLAEVFQEHHALETFDLLTERFNTLSIKLPALFAHSVSFIVCGELVIVSLFNEMCRWRVNSCETSFRVSKMTCLEGGSTCCSPLVIGRKVYWANQSGGLIVFDSELNLITIQSYPNNPVELRGNRFIQS